MNFKHIDIYGIVTVSQVGQIIIPKDARENLEIQHGEHIIVGTRSCSESKELILIRQEDHYKRELLEHKGPGFKKFQEMFKQFGVSKAGKKGQVVIPKEARDEYQIRPGTRFFMIGFKTPDDMYHLILIQPQIVKKFAMNLLNKLLDFEETDNIEKKNKGEKK